MAEQKHTGQNASSLQEAPDPDEDDLDDLDEMLDEFSSTKISQPSEAATQPPSSSENAARANQGNREMPDSSKDNEFQKQLEEGMAEMMRELESNPDMAKEFEQLMMGQFDSSSKVPSQDDQGQVSRGTDGTLESSDRSSEAPKGASDSSTASKAQAGPPPSFQDTIRQTMDRMRDSNASASAASNAPDQSSDDFMAAMLNEIAQSQGGGNGNPEDAFSNMLLGMMEQLTNKEILYEPMKELSAKFPEWLQEREPGGSKAGSITDEEKRKYQEQSSLVHEIVTRFEKPGYSDEDTEDREFIVERMQKMQAVGAPPSDLVGDMGGAAEMLGGLDSQCPQQ
ncbi:MAG: hypothetical protein Q9159_005899 [Coniocarpon cinnabarinum]